MTDDEKPRGFSGSGSGSGEPHHPPPPQPLPYPPPQYGTFQGVSNYPPPRPGPHPAIGFPQPVPPPGAGGPSAPPPPYLPHGGYQAVTGYAIAEGRPVRERRLGCCGIGCGWCLFILGFFLGGIPWYVGAIIMLCSRVDYREKPGYIACIVGAVLGTIAIIVGATKGADDW
ncbi:60S ribosomal protein L18a-like protein [Lotus japonicus]|uniref:60S ribosomal protein L18a-like protein n=1 Tax=Lotus japonicus TaxID=34305 RepID=UPI002588677B|nr:60S ribosomal protein L18a-like protein [Lotus japonicus]